MGWTNDSEGIQRYTTDASSTNNLDTPGGVTYWNDVKDLFSRGDANATPWSIKDNGFFLGRPDAQAAWDPNKNDYKITTGNQLKDAGIAAKETGFDPIGKAIVGTTLALFGGAAGGAFGAAPAAGGETLGGGSFLAANDAAMGTSGFLGSGGYTATGLGADVLGGGLAGAGLGGAGAAAMESGLADFGLGTSLGMDGATNPFSFTNGTTDFGNPFGSPTDAPWGVNEMAPRTMNGGQDLFSQGNPFDFSSPTTQSPTSPTFDAPYDVGQNLVNNPSTFGPNSMNQLFQKYGMDGAKAVMNYLQNQRQSANAKQAGQRVSNVMGQPERQPFLNEAQQIAQGNLGAGGEAIKNAVMAQAQARSAKYGYGGTENSRADVMLAQELAKYGHDRLNALLGYTGANQSTTQTAYQAQRDSMAFATQSYQGFTALAAKIGMDNSGAVGKAAQELGASIMNFFSFS